MNLDAESRLKFDRRLEDRRGWVSDAEMQAELEALPDSAHKLQPPEEDAATTAADSTSAGAGSNEAGL